MIRWSNVSSHFCSMREPTLRQSTRKEHDEEDSHRRISHFIVPKVTLSVCPPPPPTSQQLPFDTRHTAGKGKKKKSLERWLADSLPLSLHPSLCQPWRAVVRLPACFALGPPGSR